MKKSITVRVYPDERIEAEVNGTKGPACEDAIKFLREMIDIERESNKPEMYEDEEFVELDQELGE